MNFEIKVQGRPEAMAFIDPKALRKATTSAVNKVAASARSAADKQIRAEYNIKLKDLRESVELTKATWTTPHAEIRSKGRKGIPLIHFGATQRRGKGGGVSFRVKKSAGKKSFIRGAFIATVRGNRGVFIRQPVGYVKGGGYSTQRVGRYPLKHFYGPGVPLLYGSKRVERVIRKTVDDNYARVHAHEFNYYRGRR